MGIARKSDLWADRGRFSEVWLAPEDSLEVDTLNVTSTASIAAIEIGDIVVVSVKVAEPRKAVKKKEVLKALVVRQRAPFRRADGSYIRFDENAVVILEGKEPKGGRIFGPIPREIKELGYDTIASLASEVI